MFAVFFGLFGFIAVRALLSGGPVQVAGKLLVLYWIFHSEINGAVSWLMN